MGQNESEQERQRKTVIERVREMIRVREGRDKGEIGGEREM